MVNSAKEAVDAILDHPAIQAISFVGSTPVAKYVCSRGSANGTRVQAQGGGYGHALGGAVGLGFVEHKEGVTVDFVESGCFEIEVTGRRYSAKASLRPMYDPEGLRVRS